MAAAAFRFDQVTPGPGTPNRSRHDLIPGEIISLVATSPAPGPGITYTWEILDKRGSSALLSSPSGQVSSIGLAPAITRPSAFLVQLTVNDNGNITKCIRIASVRTLVANLRTPVFAETAPSAQTLNLNDPDLSTDNAVYANRSGTGVTEQNPFDWTEWAWELVQVIEALAASGGALAGDVTGPAGANTVEKLRGRNLSPTAPLVGQAIISPDGTTWAPMYAQGLKKRIRSGQTVVVGQDFQYMTKGTVTIDPGGTLTIDPEGEQVVLP